jgi:hypothetical protein
MTEALAHAQRSFVDNLRRIAVLAQVDASSGAPALRPLAGDLLRWIGEYNEAFVQANERWCGGRLHAFHQRQLTLAGRDLLGVPDDVLRIGRRLPEIGISLALSVPIDAMTRYPLVLPMLRSELRGLYVQIDCSAAQDDEPSALSEAERQALTTHVDSGGSADLVSTIADLRRLGLAEHEGFNRVGFSVARPRGEGIRPMHRLHRVAPCSDYLGWHVDAAGDVFPCIGMTGHAPARLGNIARPFAEVLQALAGTRDALVSLAERGPALPSAPSSVPFDLCALHRDAVTDLAAI